MPVTSAPARNVHFNSVSVYDAGTGRLRPSYRAAVRKSLPEGVKPTARFWQDLTRIVAAYLTSEENRAKRHPPSDIIRRWRKIAEYAKIDGTEPDSAFALVQRFAKEQITGLQGLQRDFAGKKSSHRASLYVLVFDLWCRRLGRKLAVSKVDGGVAHGPLIKFFSACVNPLLPKPLSANGISSAIKREKDRRQRHRLTKSTTDK